MYQPVYMRYPHLSKDLLVFVCDDDLWKVEFSSGAYSELTAKKHLPSIRLTTSTAQLITPKISPDGARIAYVSNESGQWDVYLIMRQGGVSERITFKGHVKLIGWSSAGHVLVSSGHGMYSTSKLFEISVMGEEVSQRSLGPVDYYHSCEHGEVVARYLHDVACWKDYRGGLVGQVWSKLNKKSKSKKSTEDFKKILPNTSSDLGFVACESHYIYYISDESGCANVHRSDFSGESAQQMSFQKDFYVRSFSVSEEHILYMAGGDLYLQTPGKRKAQKLSVAVHSSFHQLQPRFVSAHQYVHDYECSYSGSLVAVIIRGSLYVMKPWMGGARLVDSKKKYQRFRLVRSFGKSQDFLAVAVDQNGKDLLLWCQWQENGEQLRLLTQKDVGKIQDLKGSKDQKFVLISTFKNELWCLKVHAKSTSLNLISRSDETITGFDISSDFSYVAYSKCTLDVHEIWLYHVPTKSNQRLLRSYGYDVNPTFDPKEPLLYFLSTRSLAPVFGSEALSFYTFFGNVKPYVVHLTNSTSPLLDRPKEFPEESPEDGEEGSADGEKKQKKSTSTQEDGSRKSSSTTKKKKKDSVKKEKLLEVEFSGIDHRIEALPFAKGGWWGVLAKEDKVFFLRSSVSHTSDDGLSEGPSLAYGQARVYSYQKDSGQKSFHGVVKDVVLSGGGKYFLYLCDGGLYLSSSEDKSLGGGDGDKNSARPKRIELSRIRLLIKPGEEWDQMLVEAWQLQRDHFNNPQRDLDFTHLLDQYRALIPKVKTRSEFSDVMWDMQGSLRTSHCYERFGDYFKRPSYLPTAQLGADMEYQPQKKCYRIQRIYQGESWSKNHHSPLLAPQVSLKPGDEIYEVDGQGFSHRSSLERYLDNRVNTMMELGVKRSKSKDSKKKGKKAQGLERLSISTFRLNFLSYYDWCHRKRELVKKLSNGRLGYVHIPAMDWFGLSQFYKHFPVERACEGLIVDVRYNAGGHISGTIISHLLSKSIASQRGKWQQVSGNYPDFAAPKHMVCLVNGHCGSDGDIFAHAFKDLGLGPLVGTKTWGGTIGIHPRVALVDGTVTTQPEYDFVFHKGEVRIENQGVEPDIYLDLTPDHYEKNHDVQLIKAIEMLQEKLPSSQEHFSTVARPSGAKKSKSKNIPKARKSSQKKKSSPKDKLEKPKENKDG